MHKNKKNIIKPNGYRINLSIFLISLFILPAFVGGILMICTTRHDEIVGGIIIILTCLALFFAYYYLFKNDFRLEIKADSLVRHYTEPRGGRFVRYHDEISLNDLCKLTVEKNIFTFTYSVDEPAETDLKYFSKKQKKYIIDVIVKKASELNNKAVVLDYQD